MKKQFALFAFLLLALGGVAFAYDEGTDPALKEQGVMTAAEGVRIYRLVRNPNQSPNEASFASREAVVWDCVSDDNATVNLTSKAGLTGSTDALAGVVVGTIETADGPGNAAARLTGREWGYIQIYGKCLISVEATGITIGEGFRAGANDGSVVRAGNASDGSSGSFGFAYDTDADGAGVEAFIHTR